MDVRLAPSLLSADFGRLEEQVREVERAGCGMLHVDVMDGHFVPNISVGVPVVSALRKMTEMSLDVHLMVEGPDRMLPWFRDAGADSLTVHVEACRDIQRTVELAHDLGAHAALSINPPTSYEALLPHLERVEMVLVMSVEPGFPGQRFIPEVLPKVEALRAHIEREGLDVDIQVDGGVGVSTAPQAVRAGANVLVAGSAVFRGGDIGANVRSIMGALPG